MDDGDLFSGDAETKLAAGEIALAEGLGLHPSTEADVQFIIAIEDFNEARDLYYDNEAGDTAYDAYDAYDQASQLYDAVKEEVESYVDDECASEEQADIRDACIAAYNQCITDFTDAVSKKGAADTAQEYADTCKTNMLNHNPAPGPSEYIWINYDYIDAESAVEDGDYVAASGDNNRIGSQHGWYHYNEANTYWENGEWEEAVSDYGFEGQYMPYGAYTYFIDASAYYALADGFYVTAKDAFNQCGNDYVEVMNNQ